jgi:flagellin
MTVINTNIKALYTQAALSQSGRASETAMRELSTGKRINSSKDDAAGLAIASRMTQNIQGLNQSIRNAGDAISMIQTAEGATQEITVMLQRMSELAVQSANSTYSSDQRSYLNEEFQQLKSEIVRVSEVHEWNGFPILNGKAGQNVGAPNVETTARLSVSANGTDVLKIATASPKVLNDGDLSLLIEGTTPYTIPASTAASDTKSNTFASSSNAAGSAIAIAAAINSRTGETGVVAKANGAVISGAKTTVSTSSIQTDLFVNGVQVNLSLTSGQTESARRQYVMNSINAKTVSHGVVAGDSGVGGLTLTTTDGRNLSVWYDSSVAVGSDFGLGENKPTTSDPAGVTGVASAAAAAISNKTLTLSTTTSGSNTITVSSTTGLVAGMAVSGAGIPAGTTVTSVNSTTGVTLNNNATVSASSAATLSFTGGVKASTVYGTVDLDSEKQFTINPGINGYPTNATSISGNQFLFSTPGASNPSTDVISVNYGGKTGTYTVGDASTDTATNFAAAINSLAGSTVAFVGASKTTASGVTSAAAQKVLTLPDVTGLVVGMTVTGTGIAAGTKISSIGTGAVTLSENIASGGVAASTVISFAGGNTSAVQIVAASDASTMTITAPKSGSKPAASTISGLPFIAATAQVTAKDPTYSNLSSLGFVPGAVNAKNVGRLNFQVGPAANQLISIDLADFGKNGDVTGPITSDKAPTNLLTVQSANDVIMNVNKSLDRIASTRANMGAVINRLTHVIDNLTNVVMNSESSRSQIEDADYAKASTELARTQIMQQAATAVLAQANTSQQTVLKLLQG